jgi:hypothetical protein
VGTGPCFGGWLRRRRELLGGLGGRGGGCFGGWLRKRREWWGRGGSARRLAGERVARWHAHATHPCTPGSALAVWPATSPRKL